VFLTRWKAAAAVVAVLATALVVSARMGQAAFPGRNGRIVFEAARVLEGQVTQYDLFSIGASGNNLRRMTDGDGREFFPEWSPNGRRIVYVTDATRTWQIHVMRADGSGDRVITRGSSNKSGPTWSPDARAIAYVDDRRGVGDLMVKVLGGGRPKAITRFEASVRNPVWSPDGKRIAFSMENATGSSQDVYTIRPDGTRLRQITDTPVLGEYVPEWSPDGRSILFVRDRVAEPGQGVPPGDVRWADDILVIGRDGSGERNLTDTSARYEWYPAWSPDGSSIAYAVDTGDGWEIWTMRTDGTDQTRLFRFPDEPLVHDQLFEPDWQPLRG